MSCRVVDGEDRRTGIELACNDDAAGVESELFVYVEAGQTILIVVDGSGVTGNYVLGIFG